MFAVRDPSIAFSADTVQVCPCGHRLRNPRLVVGMAVALRANALAESGMPHVLAMMDTSLAPLIVDPVAMKRLSKARQGATVYSDKPPVPAGAK